MLTLLRDTSVSCSGRRLSSYSSRYIRLPVPFSSFGTRSFRRDGCYDGKQSERTWSAYEVKHDCCLFERLFRVKKNGVFLFRICFFVLEIFAFLYYANEGSDDVIDGPIKIAQYSIENKSRYYTPDNKQCSSNLAPAMYITNLKKQNGHLLCYCHGNTLGSSLFLWKTRYPHLQPFKAGRRVLLVTRMVPILS